MVFFILFKINDKIRKLESFEDTECNIDTFKLRILYSNHHQIKCINNGKNIFNDDEQHLEQYIQRTKMNYPTIIKIFMKK